MKSSMASLRVALVHDWLVTYAGGERVLEHTLKVFPQADVYTLVDFLDPEDRRFLEGRPTHHSFLQRMPFARRHYRRYLPFMPFAIEQFDLREYDLVISNSHAVAKGALTGPEQLHVCICLSPIRYAWDLQDQYLKEAGLDRGLRGILARSLLHRIRIWDARTANGVDHFIAISEFISSRITKAYGRNSTVIYPPVDISSFVPGEEAARGDFYVTAGRLAPYKRVGLLVEAFREMPERRLVVIGDGPMRKQLLKDLPSNVRYLGRQPFSVLLSHLQTARGFIFAAEEDFGIAPLEAQACGTPVVAYGRGGALETIRGLDDPAPSGVFFKEQSVTSLREAIRTLEKDPGRICAANCRLNAERFGPKRFHEELGGFMEAAWEEFSASLSRP